MGDKAPLSLVGTAKKPVCFRLCDNKPPIHYTNQDSAWFDKSITRWWLSHVIAPYFRRKYGDQKVIVLIDNCPAHINLGDDSIPSNIVLIYFPPNLTSVYQPADQGIIAQIKVGYKTAMLRKLLAICDDPVLYEQAIRDGAAQQNGLKGLDYAGKPHVLDVMKILKELWEGDKYVSRDGIIRCWRKANCLPSIYMQDLDEATAGRSDQSIRRFNADTISESLARDIEGICGSIKALSMKVKSISEAKLVVPEAVKGSICFEAEINTITDEELLEGLQKWIEIEDDPKMIDVIVDDEIAALEEANEKESDEEDNQEQEDIGRLQNHDRSHTNSERNAPLTSAEIQLFLDRLKNDKRFSSETKQSFESSVHRAQTEVLQNPPKTQRSMHLYFKTVPRTSTSSRPILAPTDQQSARQTIDAGAVITRLSAVSTSGGQSSTTSVPLINYSEDVMIKSFSKIPRVLKPLEAYFRTIVKPGDGHCFFHCIADYVNQDEELRSKYSGNVNWKLMRLAASAYLRENFETMGGSFIVAENDSAKLAMERAVRERANIIENTREYADESEIAALERYFKRPIVVYDKEGNLRRILIEPIYAIESLGWKESDFHRPWFLLFDPQVQHYDVLSLHSVLPVEN